MSDDPINRLTAFLEQYDTWVKKALWRDPKRTVNELAQSRFDLEFVEGKGYQPYSSSHFNVEELRPQFEKLLQLCPSELWDQYCRNTELEGKLPEPMATILTPPMPQRKRGPKAKDETYERIWALAREGKTSRQIADELATGPNPIHLTVEAVQSYRKKRRERSR